MSDGGGRDAASRTVAFLTGTRADFGKVQPLERAIAASGFETAYFVTGMHMLRKYGDTRLEVRRQALGSVYEFVNQSPGDEHDIVLQKTMQGFADWVAEYPVDLVVVHGDRVEALAVALVCAMRYLPCAHVEGGEVSGTIDELYRHCNSKLCRYHFVSSDAAARRLQAMGEDPADTFVIGSPELDLHSAPSGVTLDAVRKRYEIPFDDYGIALFHPVTSEMDSMRQQAQALFDSLADSGRNFVVICPNNDPGASDIMAVIDDLSPSRFRVIPSMRFNYFSQLLRDAAVVVGNSSLGVREAPFLGVPSLNVGTRQDRRANSASITDTPADDIETIRWFLAERWGTREPASQDFGGGNAGRRFAEVLSTESFWKRPRQKSFFELP